MTDAIESQTCVFAYGYVQGGISYEVDKPRLICLEIRRV